MIHRQEQVDYNISVYEQMAYTLQFNNLCDVTEIAKLRDHLVNSLPDVNSEEKQLENCAQNAAAHLKRSNHELSYRLLMLQKTLRQGEWITSLPYMIQRTLDSIRLERKGCDRFSRRLR